MKKLLFLSCILGASVSLMQPISIHTLPTTNATATAKRTSPTQKNELVTGTWHEQGIRPTMEDSDVNYTTPQGIYIAGVFDGHGGRLSADIAAQYLPQILVSNTTLSTNDKEAAIKNAFLTTDSLCTQHTHDGTTAVVAIIDNNNLYIANAGDARAIIVHKDGQAEQLSHDHKASDPAEVERIEKLGGTIITIGVPRVQGVLAVARALGDGSLKPFVTAEPFIKKVTLTSQDQFLILACDGVWDVLQNQQTADFVHQQLHAIQATPQSITPEQAEQIAKKLVLHALKLGSTDNVTAKIIFLKNRANARTQQDN